MRVAHLNFIYSCRGRRGHMHGVKFTYPADKRLKRLANVHFHGNLNIEVQDLHDFLALEWSFRLRTL